MTNRPCPSSSHAIQRLDRIAFLYPFDTKTLKVSEAEEPETSNTKLIEVELGVNKEKICTSIGYSRAHTPLDVGGFTEVE